MLMVSSLTNKLQNLPDLNDWKYFPEKLMIDVILLVRKKIMKKSTKVMRFPVEVKTS